MSKPVESNTESVHVRESTRAPRIAPVDVTAQTRLDTEKLKKEIKYGPSDLFLRENVSKVMSIRQKAETDLTDTAQKDILLKSLEKPTPANVRQLQDLLVTVGYESLAGIKRPSVAGLSRYDGQIGENVLKAVESWLVSLSEVKKIAQTPALPNGKATLGVSLNPPVANVPSKTVETLPSAPSMGQKYESLESITVAGKTVTAGQTIEFQGFGAGGAWVLFKEAGTGNDVEVLVDRDVFERLFKKIEATQPAKEAISSQKNDATKVVDVISDIPVLPSRSGIKRFPTSR